jgi:glycosyltransferase involved in cell wall biosynthesis
VRVLHLTAGNLFGGIETYLVTLARCRHLAPEMEPHFGLCFPGRLRNELVAEGVPVRDLGPVRLSRPWTVWAARRALADLLRRIEFGAVVVHGSWPHAVFAPTVRRAGVQLVNAVHGDLSKPNRFDRWAAATPPDLVIANSRYTAGPAGRLFARSPVEVVYPPVPAPETIALAATRCAVRAELRTPAEAVVILIVSRIEELKGHAVLIDALGHLRDLLGWAAWVVGGAQRPHEVELLAGLKRRADEVGVTDRVRWVGERNDVRRVMTSADIVCQPNTGPEGFGLTLVESLYAGLPVVTTGFGGAVEVLDETCGVLTPPGDSVAVAAALRTLIREPVRRTELGLAGPARARSLCDPGEHLKCLGPVLARQSEATWAS